MLLIEKGHMLQPLPRCVIDAASSGTLPTLLKHIRLAPCLKILSEGRRMRGALWDEVLVRPAYGFLVS
jgi:hypothetical protein